MTILVACDEYCSRKGNTFYLREFGHTLVNRYLMVFDKVRFVVRTRIVDNSSDLGKYNIPVTDPRIEIYPIAFFQGPIQYLKSYLKIQRELAKVANDVSLGILRLPSATAFAVWDKLKAKKIPYAAELVFDCFDGYRQAKGIHKLLWKRMHLQQLDVCRNAVGVAPVTARYMQTHYMPMDSEIVKGSYSSVELPDDFFASPRSFPAGKTPTLVHVSLQIEFNGRKGHNDIIKALRILKDQNITVNAVFVGEDYNGGIAKLNDLALSLGVESQIIFTGYLNYSQLRSRMLDSDIAILPTKAEGLPRVLIEAMAVGLPAIASNVSGNPELIDSEFLFDYGDVASIATQIKSLVSSPARYEATSKKNYEKSLEFRKDVLDRKRKDFFNKIRQRVE